MKTKSLEQELVNMFIDIMKRKAREDKKPIHFVQLETGATAIGVPDLLMFFDNQMYWIECKRCKLPMSSNVTSVPVFSGSIVFRPGQVRFLHRLLDCGEKVFVLVLSEGCDCCAIPIKEIPLTCEGVFKLHHKGAEYTEAYNYIKGLLK